MTESTNNPTDPDEDSGREPDREPASSPPSPRRRRQRPAQPTPPTQEELDRLPVEQRQEILNQAHQRRHGRVATWAVIVTTLVTVLSLAGAQLMNAFTIRNNQEQIELLRQGQVTERFTRASELLSSDKRAVRTAAVYALERIAKDSPRDRRTIRDVLATFIRDRATVQQGATSSPGSDVVAAFTVLARRPSDPEDFPRLDLHGVRLPAIAPPDGANLASANLTGADLTDANLNGANLAYAILTGANLNRANLAWANLTGADLTGTDLNGANLDHAQLQETVGAPKRGGGG